jgi:DNA repair exonuclease SbcCD ATPase subunit
MPLQIDTVISNKRPSPKLKQMLMDLRSNTGAWIDSIEEIRQQAHKEGFTDEQTKLLLKQYLSEFLSRRQVKWLVVDKPRREAEKKLTEKLDTSVSDANMRKEQEHTVNIPTDYKVVVPDQVLEEETKQLQQEQEPISEALETLRVKPDYEGENSKMQLDKANNKITELTTQIKNLEEKNKQLEARTRASSSDICTAIQGNTLRTKIVINQLFREILYLKGLKEIYANVVIDVSQNKYLKLETLPIRPKTLMASRT